MNSRSSYIMCILQYLRTKIPPIVAAKEEERLMEQLTQARESTEPGAWKLEAQALIDLGHLARWVGRHDDAAYYLQESSKVCRFNTLTKVLHEDDEYE